MNVPASTFTISILIPFFTGMEIVLLPEAIDDEPDEYPEVLDEDEATALDTSVPVILAV